jgi:hemoglobin
VGGGTAAFGRWLNRLYDLVEEEGTLAPLFGGTVSEEHRVHVLALWVEVMGGPARYTADLGGYPAMLAHHRGLAITGDQRRLFVNLPSRAADEVELPADPQFRAAIIGYAEWGLAPRDGAGASRRRTKARSTLRCRLRELDAPDQDFDSKAQAPKHPQLPEQRQGVGVAEVLADLTLLVHRAERHPGQVDGAPSASAVQDPAGGDAVGLRDLIDHLEPPAAVEDRLVEAV